MANKPVTKQAKEYIFSIVDYVMDYVSPIGLENETQRDWFEIKKQILFTCQPQYRGYFSRRHNTTKKFFINDLEKEIIKYWNKKAGWKLHIDKDKLHDDNKWERKEKGWALQEYNKKQRENKKPYEFLLKKYRDLVLRGAHEYSISEEQFLKLLLGECHYCGSPPISIKKYAHSQFIYNEIDRLDEDFGYTIQNLVPICKICRASKRKRTKKQFLKWIEQIYKTHFSND